MRPRIVVNGSDVDLDEPMTVHDVVARTLGPANGSVGPVDGRGIAVAVNAEVVPRGDWSSTVIVPDDTIEIVTAVQGG